MMMILSLVVFAVTTVVRAAILRASASASVDHYYWLLAARAYRERSRLPARIVGKYLLEDERQAYPPFFGWLLSLIREASLTAPWARWYSQAVDAILAASMLCYAWSTGLAPCSAPVILGIVGTAPILAAYNTQLTSRAFGNLFLVMAILAAVPAVRSPDTVYGVVGLGVAAMSVAGVVLTHKMSFQLLAVCWPIWAVVERDWQLVLVLPAGVVISVLITGPSFARLQWFAHKEIVVFWHKHWNRLGAHAFHASPIYGTELDDGALFHRPGIRKALAHFVRAFGYNPYAWLVPFTTLWAGLPPSWVLVWTLVPLAVCLLTLYVSQLRCFGAGHLYVFNSVAPSSVWWASVIPEGDWRTFASFAVATAATIFSLLMAYRTRKAGAGVRDTFYQAALEHLSRRKSDRLAIFPLTAAEEAAFRTPHAILWGGHGLGFPKIEPVFPVVQKPISEIMAEYRCRNLLFDTRYWPEGLRWIELEMPNAEVLEFGSWRVVHLSAGSAYQDRAVSCAASSA